MKRYVLYLQNSVGINTSPIEQKTDLEDSKNLDAKNHLVI